jgi:hypothetical protein
MTPTVAFGPTKRVTRAGVWRCPSCGRSGTDAMLLAMDGHVTVTVWCSDHARTLVHCLTHPSTPLEEI